MTRVGGDYVLGSTTESTLVKTAGDYVPRYASRADPRGLVLKPALDPYAKYDPQTLKEILAYKAKIRERYKLEFQKQRTEVFLGLRRIVSDPAHIRHTMAFYGREDLVPKFSLRMFAGLFLGIFLPVFVLKYALQNSVKERAGFVQTYSLFGGWLTPKQRQLAMDNLQRK